MRSVIKTDFFTPPKPRLMAHRGGGGVRPENTIAAFEAAYRLGIRYFELDIHASRDGVLMVCHDDNLGRTTDIGGLIRDLALAEIGRADAGYAFAQDGAFPFRAKGIRIPRLIDVLALFDDAFFVIEIKQIEPSIAGALDRMLTASRTRRRALVASEHQQPLDEFRSLAPDVPTSFSGREVLGFFAAMFGANSDYRSPADALQIPPAHQSMRLATPASIDAAHALGLEMHTWTINEDAEIRELLSMGIDGIISDYPARLLSAA